MIHALLAFILVAAIIGFIVWIINNYLPIPQLFKTIIMVVAAIAVLLFGLQQLGVHL